MLCELQPASNGIRFSAPLSVRHLSKRHGELLALVVAALTGGKVTAMAGQPANSRADLVSNRQDTDVDMYKCLV